MSVYYNDIDPYCCKVLRKQIHLGNLPEGHVDERDIREVRASDLVGYQHIHLFAGIGGFPLGFKWAGFPDHISILTGGFPCQDISNAGKRAGIDGDRSGLWSEFYRVICELRPRYILVENVSALLHRGMGRVLGDLSKGGYDAEWTTLSACSLGAPHMRERVFIVAYPRCEHESRWLRDWNGTQDGSRPDLSSIRSQNRNIAQMVAASDRGLRQNWWRVESPVDRMAPRVPRRMDRLRGLGNAVVPQAPERIGYGIMTAIKTDCEAVS